MPEQIAREHAWSLNPTPEIVDELVVEIVDRDRTGYSRLAPGSAHPDRSKYPSTLLVDEKPVEGSDSLSRRYWSTQYSNQDLYNYGIQYSGESASHPIWARRYLIRRDQYAVDTYGSAFTGLYRIKVTAGGSDYASAPQVSFSGGGGSGATAVAIMDGRSVAWVRITAEGTGYTSAPTVTFSGGGGSGATATAAVQGAAKLVHEEVQELPADDPRRSLFVLVMKVWETIPGPAIVGTRVNSRGDTETVTKQRVATGTATTDETLLQTESSVVPENNVVANQTTAVAASHSTFTHREFNRERAHGAEATTAEDIIEPGSGADALPSLSLTTISAEITQFTKKKKRKRVTTIAGQPVLSGTHVDEQTGITIDYTKQFVAAGTLGGVSGTTYTEIQPFDKWMSIQIASTLRTNSIPADKSYFGTQRESFPNVLRDIEFIAFDDLGRVVSAGYRLIEGYSGPLLTRRTRKYMTDTEYRNWPNTNAGTIFPKRPDLVQFFPEESNIVLTLPGNDFQTPIRLPMSLHEQHTWPWYGQTLELRATSPTTLPWDEWIIRTIDEEQWRFGYWVVEITEVLVPSDPDAE